MEKGEIFERANFIDGIDGLTTTEAQVFVRSRAEALADRHILCSP